MSAENPSSEIAPYLYTKRRADQFVADVARLLELLRYFFTISAFANISTPSLSVTFPFKVIVLPAYSAS